MSNIKSFGDIGNQSDDGSDDGGEGMNELYAGGAKSGQVVRGAPKPKDDDDEDNVASLFDKARRAGAVQGTADDMKKTQPSSTFQGTGRTLAGGSSQAAPQQQQQGPLLYVITFYRNNIFTVNDGPARSILDPANRNFMEAIGKGECPEELEPELAGTPITVNLVKNESDYQEPEKAKMAAFQGTGRTLVSDTSGAASSSTQAAAAAAASQGEWEGVNAALPTTSLQLRLADGSRMVASFNHTHRISDIRRFIRAARPDLVFGYSLMTGVPPIPIAEAEDKTLEEAGLLNSVIIQKK